MRFWDSSAVIPLLLPEDTSSRMIDLLRRDPGVVLWWASSVECLSGIRRRHREEPIPEDVLDRALERAEALHRDADIVTPSEEVRRIAGRMLAVHALRAGDALQLAAALVWCEDRPDGEELVTLDERLRSAAAREGFSVMPGPETPGPAIGSPGGSPS